MTKSNYQEIINNIKFEEDDISVIFKEETWCEHCGHLDPFTAVIDYNGIRYCVSCELYNGLGLTDKEQFVIEYVETELMLEYHSDFVDRLRGYKWSLDKHEQI